MKFLKRLNLFDRLMAAITFAEMGEHKTALRFLSSDKDLKKRATKQKRNTKRPENRPQIRM